jgi:hypothetical protein
MWKNVVEPESTDDITHEHFTLDVKGYKQPLTAYEIVVALILQQL